VSAETGLPLRWGPAENIRWKVNLPGRGVSCPVIASGRVYVTACSGYKQRRLHVLCFDATTGQQHWERQFTATGNTQCHPKTCMAAPTPVTDGQRVYALFATGDLACLDRDGNLRWYRSLVGDYPNITNQVGLAASPILCRDLLFLPMENAGDSFAAALDKHTGQNRWKVARRRDINWVTPQIVTRAGRSEVLFQTSAEITAYDTQTGSQRWSYPGGASSIVSPAIADDLILVAGGEMVALRPDKADGPPQVVWNNTKLRTGYASAVCYQGRVYAINAQILNCATAATGKQLWQQRIKGEYSASPVAADGKIYVVNEAGLTTVLEAGDSARILRTNALAGTFLATPAIANGAVYLRSDDCLYCIAAEQHSEPKSRTTR
jgi:outer membrane protein assembly factor BamB